MALILNIETSTKVCSVALGKEGQPVAHRRVHDEQYSHAEKLNLLIEEVMAEAKTDFSQIDAVAVSKGPGSYTGLRIGVSSAKGFCYGTEKPLIAINTLRILATAVKEHSAELTNNALLCPMLDARRMEVYTALYDTELNIVEPTKALIVNETSFAQQLEMQPIYFFGNGAAKCMEVIDNHNAHLFENLHPEAKTMCPISEAKYTAQEFEDVAYFEPYYLKDFIATVAKKLV